MSTRVGATFPRSTRLTRAADYRSVFQANTRISDDCFTLLYAKAGTGHSRLGLAVAKKQIKRAVDRNRLKRLIRESFRLHQKRLPEVDVVVMVRYKILQLSNRDIFERLHNLWGRIR